MSDFLMCQILLNISNIVNIKLNIPNPSKSIQFIVLIHFIIFVCIPFLFGIAESLTWESIENHHPSLAKAKDSRIQRIGTPSVHFCRDLFSEWWHFWCPWVFLEKMVMHFPSHYSLILSFFFFFMCPIWIYDILYPSVDDSWFLISWPGSALTSSLASLLSPRLNSGSHFTDVRPRTLLYSILYVPVTLGLLSFLFTVFLVYYMLAKEILFTVIIISKFLLHLFVSFEASHCKISKPMAI